jgi:hypothetical protein
MHNAACPDKHIQAVQVLFVQRVVPHETVKDYNQTK